MSDAVKRLKCGMITENPTFVQMLGMCPTMAVTTSAVNGIGMGLTTTVILVLSNMMISALRRVIPDKVRIPAYIVIVASFVTIVQFLLEGFVPSLYDSLGIYIPLIVVNCIILGRAESFASKNNVWLSMFDGIGMGLGFTIGLTSIGIFRELFGNGSVFGLTVMPESYQPISILILAPGAFFVLACLIAVQNKVRLYKAKRAGEAISICEREDGCASCTNTLCGGKAFTMESVMGLKEKPDKKMSVEGAVAKTFAEQEAPVKNTVAEGTGGIAPAKNRGSEKTDRTSTKNTVTEKGSGKESPDKKGEKTTANLTAKDATENADGTMTENKNGEQAGENVVKDKNKNKNGGEV